MDIVSIPVYIMLLYFIINFFCNTFRFVFISNKSKLTQRTLIFTMAESRNHNQPDIKKARIGFRPDEELVPYTNIVVVQLNRHNLEDTLRRINAGETLLV